MPEAEGLPDPPRVLVHTAYNLSEDVSSCLLAGADSYLHKSTCCGELLDAVRSVAAGEGSGVGDTVGESRSRIQTTQRGARLTPREQEILVLTVRRFSNLQIGEALRLALPTVKTHVRNVLRKLGFKSRRELF